MQQRKNFIKINEAFICENCKKGVSKGEKTCRNHCSQCLYSKHVDENVPGDRLSDCQGLMKPVEAELTKKKGTVITHLCENCGLQKKNLTLPDDNMDIIISLIVKTNEKRAKNAHLT